MRITEISVIISSSVFFSKSYKNKRRRKWGEKKSRGLLACVQNFLLKIAFIMLALNEKRVDMGRALRSPVNVNLFILYIILHLNSIENKSKTHNFG